MFSAILDIMACGCLIIILSVVYVLSGWLRDQCDRFHLGQQMKTATDNEKILAIKSLGPHVMTLGKDLENVQETVHDLKGTVHDLKGAVQIIAENFQQDRSQKGPSEAVIRDIFREEIASSRRATSSEISVLRIDAGKKSDEFNKRLDKFIDEVNKSLYEVSKESDAVNNKSVKVNNKFDEVNKKEDEVNKKEDEVNKREDDVNKRLDGMNDKLDKDSESEASSPTPSSASDQQENSRLRQENEGLKALVKNLEEKSEKSDEMKALLAQMAADLAQVKEQVSNGSTANARKRRRIAAEGDDSGYSSGSGNERGRKIKQPHCRSRQAASSTPSIQISIPAQSTPGANASSPSQDTATNLRIDSSVPTMVPAPARPTPETNTTSQQSMPINAGLPTIPAAAIGSMPTASHAPTMQMPNVPSASQTTDTTNENVEMQMGEETTSTSANLATAPSVIQSPSSMQAPTHTLEDDAMETVETSPETSTEPNNAGYAPIAVPDALKAFVPLAALPTNTATTASQNDRIDTVAMIYLALVKRSGQAAADGDMWYDDGLLRRLAMFMERRMIEQEKNRNKTYDQAKEHLFDEVGKSTSAWTQFYGYVERRVRNYLPRWDADLEAVCRSMAVSNQPHQVEPCRNLFEVPAKERQAVVLQLFHFFSQSDARAGFGLKHNDLVEKARYEEESLVVQAKHLNVPYQSLFISNGKRYKMYQKSNFKKEDWELEINTWKRDADHGKSNRQGI